MAPVTSEEIIQINYFGAYYLIVLVCTKTAIHLSTCRWLGMDVHLAASRLGKYPSLATSTSVNSC